MKNVARPLLLLLALGLLSPARSEEYDDTGNYWLNQCRKNSSYCVGFIQGVEGGRMIGMVDSLASATVSADKDSGPKVISAIIDGNKRYCLPDGVTYGQMRDIFVKALESSPETRHESGSYLLTEAMGKAFPCAETNSSK